MGGTLERLAGLLPELAGELDRRRDTLREVRIRADRPAWLDDGAERFATGGRVSPERLGRVLAALLDHSLHAREDELRQGFFTLEDGCRAGVCGQALTLNGRVTGMGAVGSLCVRVARAVPGCADGLMPHVVGPDGPRSVLLASPPGMGKTTCLRDVARQLSLAGRTVCVADERHELAACRRGVPALDLGPCADVMDGGPKALTIPLMLRGMAPEVIVTDEIGGPGDAAALADARRCGAAVIASAHGSDLDALLLRGQPGGVLSGGVFDRVILLGRPPGTVRAVYARINDGRGGFAWACA